MWGWGRDTREGEGLIGQLEIYFSVAFIFFHINDGKDLKTWLMTLPAKNVIS